MMSSSPDRDTFQARAAQQRAEEGKTSAENAANMAEIYQTTNQQRREREQDLEWQKNNMEYDMRTADWMVAKTRESKAYAQNLYAAMCNRDFQKNDVWPVLKNETWAASWRSAGGIVADMRGEGDYMDWYCSGIGNAKLGNGLTGADGTNYVPESVVTDEICADLMKLGWLVLDAKEGTV